MSTNTLVIFLDRIYDSNLSELTSQFFDAPEMIKCRSLEIVLIQASSSKIDHSTPLLLRALQIDLVKVLSPASIKKFVIFVLHRSDARLMPNKI